MKSMSRVSSRYAWWLLIVSALLVGGATAYRIKANVPGVYSCCGYGGNNGCRYLDSGQICSSTDDCNDDGDYANCCADACNQP